MPDVCICFERGRQATAERLARSLRLHGYDVWPDETQFAARDLAGEAGSRIRSAQAVIALWCGGAVASSAMREHAALAKALGVLISVRVEPCVVPESLGDAIELSGWDGRSRDSRLSTLLSAVAVKTGRTSFAEFEDYGAAERRGSTPPPSPSGFSLEASSGGELSRSVYPGMTRLVPIEEGSNGGGKGREPALAVAMTEWRSLKDSTDTLALKRFAAHFPGYYGDLALDRAATLDKQASRTRAEEAAREYGYRAEGRVPVMVGARPFRDEARWIKPGGGRDPAETFGDMPGGPEMVVVPAAPQGVTIGSPEREAERLPEREPQRLVAFAEPFAVGRLAVTRGEFSAFVSATGHPMGEGKWRNPGFAQDDRHPAVCVSWEDASAYVAWLSRMTGKRYRLPSESEWEYAARAGSTTPFWWGTTITPAQANYDGTRKYLGGGYKGVYRHGTLPADYTHEQFRPNPWGLHQVHGNIWEWCADCWNETPPDEPAGGVSAIRGDRDYRVLRGGAHVDFPGFLRAAFRNALGPRLRAAIVGFRVARAL